MTKQQTIFRGAHGEQPYFMMLRKLADEVAALCESGGDA